MKETAAAPLRVHAVVSTLVTVASALLALSVLGQILTRGLGASLPFGLVPLFDVDQERSIPTFFSALLLAFSALLFALIGRAERGLRRSDHRYWYVLMGGFLLMAFDEAAHIHEEINAMLKSIPSGIGTLENPWALVAIAPIMVLGALFLGFLGRIPKSTRRHLLVAAALYLTGVIVIELLDGAYAQAYGAANLAYAVLVTIEEAFEMAGIIVLNRGLLLHLAAESPILELRLPAYGEAEPVYIRAED